MSKFANKTSVVVVGGGHAGTAIAKSLSAKLDQSKHTLTLITARPFFVFQPALVRLAVTGDKDLASQVLMPYDQLFANGIGKVVTGTVEKIEDRKDSGSVVLESGDRVFYDILILATGANWNVVHPPTTQEGADTWLKTTSTSIQNSKSIVLVGGGAIGAEFAGEIKDVYPEKKVTIVHGDRLLLNKAYPDRFRNAVTASVHARGTELVLDDFVDQIPAKGESTIVTRKGKTLKADLVLQTRGPKPATDFLSSLPSSRTANGYVRVRPTLQLADYSHIFAAGDIIDWEEQKQAGKVDGHASVITANVLSIIAGNEAKTVYKGSPEIIVVTNGKNGGVSYMGFLWGLVFGNWVSRLIKSKGLLIPMGRAKMGLSA